MYQSFVKMSCNELIVESSANPQCSIVLYISCALCSSDWLFNGRLLIPKLDFTATGHWYSSSTTPIPGLGWERST